MTDLAIYRPGELATAAPPSGPLDDWIAVADQVVRLAEVIHQSPFVPNGLRGSVPATAAAILTGRELGIPPMTSLANIHVIGGKPGLSALVMRALILSQGHEWQDVEVTDTRAKVRGRRKGETEWTEASFTADQARTAKIMLGGYPQDKLYARATSRLARRKFADVIAGMPYSAEELEDGEVAEEAPPSASNGEAPKPAPRTAQRRTRASAGRPTTAAPAAATAPTTAPATAQTAPSDPALPPLPGEDEPGPTQPGPSSAGPSRPQRETSPQSASSPGSSGTEPDERDYDSPGTITTPQLTAIWTVLRQVFGFTADEKDQARAVAAHIISRAITSTRDMSRNEGKVILDTLSNWQATAGERGEQPRDLLIAYMAATQAQDAHETAGPGDGDG